MKEEVNIFKKQIVGYQLLSAALAIGLISMFGDYINVKAENEALRNMNELLLEIDYEQYQQYQEYEEVEQYQEVMFTNYHLNDGSSTTKVGSGLTINDFEINEYGFYTFRGRVVLAAATVEGLNSDFGVLANYNEPSEEIKYYQYFDEVEIEINGNRMQGVILDTCGSSMELQPSDNGLNRIDIFLADETKAFGKVKGKVYENN